jgi:hypothetical protein
MTSLKYKTDRKKTKEHRILFQSINLLENNKILINAEDFYIPHFKKEENRETTVREIVGNIYSIKLDNSGRIIWEKEIYKSQIVKPRLANHSYFSTTVNGNSYILFTDSKTKKQNKKTSFFLKDKDLQNLNGIRLTSTGNLSEEIILKNEKSKYRLMPIEGVMINQNTAIIPAKNHQFIKFYKLHFN